MGVWSCLPALLAVWSLVSCQPTGVSRQQLQPAVSSHDGVALARLRRSRTPRSGGGTGRYLKAGSAVPPPFQRVSQMDSVVIECEFRGAPPPVIDWLRDGRVIHPASLTESLEERTNSLTSLSAEPTQAIAGTRARLYLDCVTPRDQGVYTCRGQTPTETKSVSTRLFVDEPLSVESAALCERVKDMDVSPARIIQWRRQILAQIGDPVRLICETTGYPAPLISWHKNEEPIATGDPRVTVLPNGELVIESLQWSDMGLYTCQAANEFATDKVTTFLYPFLPEN
ncbi:neural/ectodermal development factor IMP-L2-like [Amphibalanus amphitrite]|nr:neural/ectodermal development factor IMP-L2-like [Amphibalanus amphitrite]